MSGFVVDWSMTQYLLGHFMWIKESNTNFLPELGLPLLVLAYIFGDLALPQTRTHTLIMYTLSLMQWTGPFQNILVLFNITPGMNFFYTIPFIWMGTFVTLYLIFPKSPVNLMKNSELEKSSLKKS